MSSAFPSLIKLLFRVYTKFWIRNVLLNSSLIVELTLDIITLSFVLKVIFLDCINILFIVSVIFTLPDAISIKFSLL